MLKFACVQAHAVSCAGVQPYDYILEGLSNYGLVLLLARTFNYGFCSGLRFEIPILIRLRAPPVAITQQLVINRNSAAGLWAPNPTAAPSFPFAFSVSTIDIDIPKHDFTPAL